MEKLIPAEEEVLEKMYEATKEETDALRGKLDKAQEELLPWSAFCKLACMRLCCQGQWPFKLSRDLDGVGDTEEVSFARDAREYAAESNDHVRLRLDDPRIFKPGNRSIGLHAVSVS